MDYSRFSGDTIYADNPIPAEAPLSDGTVGKNVTTELTSKVAERLPTAYAPTPEACPACPAGDVPSFGRAAADWNPPRSGELWRAWLPESAGSAHSALSRPPALGASIDASIYIIWS
jgi:hypothetical protein